MLVSKIVLSTIVRFKLRILETKKSEKRAHGLAHSSSGRIVSVELEWSKSLTVHHFYFGSTDSDSRSHMNSLCYSSAIRKAVEMCFTFNYITLVKTFVIKFVRYIFTILFITILFHNKTLV